MARAAVVKFEFVNKADFLRALERLGPQADAGMEVALRQEAGKIMGRSEGMVPQDTGALVASGFVGVPHRVARGVEVTFGYSSPYALYQHYGNYDHPNGGQKQFLSKPTKSARSGLVARVRAVLERYLR